MTMFLRADLAVLRAAMYGRVRALIPAHPRLAAPTSTLSHPLMALAAGLATATVFAWQAEASDPQHRRAGDRGYGGVRRGCPRVALEGRRGAQGEQGVCGIRRPYD